jgi:hypothetical protein
VQYFTSSFILALIRWCEKKSTAAAGEKYKKEKKRRAGTLSLAGHTGKMGRATRHTPPPLYTPKQANNIVYVYALMVRVGGFSRFLARWYLKRVERVQNIYTPTMSSTLHAAVAQNIESVAYVYCCMRASVSLCTTGDDAEEETDAAHWVKKGNNPVCVLGMMHYSHSTQSIML